MLRSLGLGCAAHFEAESIPRSSGVSRRMLRYAEFDWFVGLNATIA